MPVRVARLLPDSCRQIARPFRSQYVQDHTKSDPETDTDEAVRGLQGSLCVF